MKYKQFGIDANFSADRTRGPVHRQGMTIIGVKYRSARILFFNSPHHSVLGARYAAAAAVSVVYRVELQSESEREMEPADHRMWNVSAN